MDKPMLNILWDQRKAQRNFIKHGVTFAQAATVILDPLAITVFDAAHSEKEDRWFTLGMSSGYLLLAVSHTYRVGDNGGTYIRLISARQATRKERAQYENVN